MILVSLAGSLASFGWGLALGFALAVVVLVSLVAVVTFPKDALMLSVDSPRGRAFKGEEISAGLNISSKRGASLAQFELAQVPEGLEAAIVGDGAKRRLSVNSRYAGVFSGLKVRVGILDPLGIFARTEVHSVRLSFEFLPTFLLAKKEPMRVSAAILGDFPAGRGGYGQEFYSAEMYTPASSSRDIMWKRQAKLPNDSLMVRVGEANIPEKLTVCFIERLGVEDRRSPRWMDLASEAIARVGLPVVSTGTTLRLLHIVGETEVVAETKDAGGLANILIGLWSEGPPAVGSIESPRQADMIIVAETETASSDVMGLVLDKPSVLLGWGQQKKAARGSNVIFFSGREDVSGLVARVLSR
jgi:hypothetical protein